MDQINWVLVFLVCNFVLSLFNSISSRHKVAQEELDSHKNKIEKEINELWAEFNKQGRELSGIKPVVDSKPNHDDLAKVYEEIRRVSENLSSLSSNVSSVSGQLKGVNELLNRMDTFWRNHSKD